MRTSLIHLLGATPSWANALVTGPGVADVKVRPPRASGRETPELDLVVSLGETDGIIVAERRPGTVLPACCPERHINPGGSFCVHLDSTDPITNAGVAAAWWESLRRFLIGQDYASRHRFWPLHMQLSHGHEAARVQIEMEKIAEPLDWVEEVHLGIFRREGWLGTEIRSGRVRNGTLGMVPNARSRCPRGCRRSGGRYSCHERSPATGAPSDAAPVLRADCPNRREVEALVLLERRRRRAERDVASWLKQIGIVCCGTMDHCLLA